MRKIIQIIGIEAIPNIASYIYSIIAAKNPILKNLYKEVADEVVREISSGKILDVGTGPGYLPIEIIKRAENLKIIGIDLSPTMVKIAYRNAKRMGLSRRVKFQIANASELPFEDEYFDFVVSTASFHHWLQPAKCLKEIYRVLKKGSKAWIYDINREITKEVKVGLRKKYGCFLSYFFVHVVRLHSSVRYEEIEEILSSSELAFSNSFVEDKGAILKIKLQK